MKSRPRSVENRVAEAFNAHYARMGLSPVERIPVLGRTGPDLSINELQLVVDVKSRNEIPKTIFFPLLGPFVFDGLTAVRLCCFMMLLDNVHAGPSPALDFSSKVVRGYIEHMEAWTREKAPDGVSCVVLHRPEIPIGNSVVIIQSQCRRRLMEYAGEYASRSN